jgi:hypothetical protein
MLTYLLIILVIALALAPLGHFLPSKRQRELARMREYAAVHGLFVEFRNAPTLGGARRVRPREVIYYGKRLPAALATPIESATWVRREDGWRCVGSRQPVPAPVAELSTEVLAASIDPSSCGVYWTESDGEAGVEQIRLALERWSVLVGR